MWSPWIEGIAVGSRSGEQLLWAKPAGLEKEGSSLLGEVGWNLRAVRWAKTSSSTVEVWIVQLRRSDSHESD